MSQKRAERVAIVSGKNGYVQLTQDERKAFRVEVYFSATNVGENNYYSYEWYKKRTLYGRFKVARGEYTSKEKLVQYQNELIYSEEATLFELIKRLQCDALERFENLEFIAEYVVKIGEKLEIAFEGEIEPIGLVIQPPEQISIPGLQVDGIYYSMMPGCAGELTFQTWYDEDECLNPNNNEPLIRDNRGDAPDSAVDGDPPSGDEDDVPFPSTPPGADYVDPTPGEDEATEESEPGDPQGITSTLYTCTVTWNRAVNSNLPANPYVFTVIGRYGALQNRSTSSSSVDYGFYHGIGHPGSPAQGNWAQVVSGGGVDQSGGVDIRTYVQNISFAPQ